MALDFPSAPTTGQTYTGPNGIIWSWDGSKWVNGTQVATGYASLVSPVFQGNPQAPNPPAGDADQSLATTAFVQATIAPSLNNVGRNLLHNGLFNVAQRGAGGWTTSGAYTVDRWVMWVALDTLNVSLSTFLDAARAQIGDEAARFGVAVGVTGNAGATSLSMLEQRIETVQRLSGKTVILSFWAIGSTNTIKLGATFAQNFGSGGSPSPSITVSGGAVTLATTWARYSFTFNVPSTAGKTFGSNGGTDFSAVAFWFSAGANSSAIAGVPVQTGSFTLWGVQLEVAQPGQTLPSPLEKPDWNYDYGNCRRFYQFGGVGGYAYGTAGGIIGSLQNLVPAMRGSPTVTPTSVNYSNASNMTVTFTAGQFFVWNATVTAAGMAYATGNMTVSSDL
jgi:hypothetical protein